MSKGSDAISYSSNLNSNNFEFEFEDSSSSLSFSSFFSFCFSLFQSFCFMIYDFFSSSSSSSSSSNTQITFIKEWITFIGLSLIGFLIIVLSLKGILLFFCKKYQQKRKNEFKKILEQKKNIQNKLN